MKLVKANGAIKEQPLAIVAVFWQHHSIMKRLLPMLLAGLNLVAHAGTVTLTGKAPNGTNTLTDLAINQYEIAELASFVGYSYANLSIIKDGRTIEYGGGPYALSLAERPLVVAGPAIFRLTVYNNGNDISALATFRISPEAFPPDRTILVPPGTNQVQITLECSTNLVNWFSATNGVYGPLPEAKFFRIKLDKIQ